MYVAARFEMPAADQRRYLEQIRGGNLVTIDPADGQLVATYLPWVFAAEPDRLLTHLSKVNPQWRHDQSPVLIIADIAVAGVDASWQADYRDHQAVPSLIYETLHIYGRLSADTSLAGNLDSWDKMLAGHQSDVQLDELDPAYLEAKAKASVAVTVTISHIEAKSKLAQNTTAADAETIMAQVAPTCPQLARRIGEVTLPYIRARDGLVEAARAKSATR